VCVRLRFEKARSTKHAKKVVTVKNYFNISKSMLSVSSAKSRETTVKKNTHWDVLKST